MSWRILWKQTVFPFLALVVSVGGALAFSLFVYRLGVVQTIIAHTHHVGNSSSYTTDDIGAEQTRNIFVVLGALVGYLFVAHVFNFFLKAALAASTNAQLSGETNGLGRGISAIFLRFFPILGWLFVSGFVGFLLGMRSSNSNNANPVEGAATNLMQGILDSAWNVITFLTVPLIVAENVGPINAIKRSSQLVRDTWGRQLIGRYGVTAIIGGITGVLLSLIVVIGGGLTFVTRSANIGIATGLLVVSALMCTGALRNALLTIYQTVLYRYANKQTIPGYAPNAFQAVFAPKQS